MGGYSSEIQGLSNILHEREEALRVEVSSEKSTIMVISMNNTSADINMNGENVETVIGSKCI
ncbi:hypothetical protein DPMN_056455 [Dreissena polymorpha]|uniref:Uncharacterized protein n=1 Tax=Dreissena polymorpha TaxID=45954 RepID=A0A9D4HRI8_DREPO|nr:hypothetical protein DPMN_056455 [Dreissena polymorpha]